MVGTERNLLLKSSRYGDGPEPEQTDVQKPFNPISSFWNSVKAFAGAGTFALPWAIMNAGMYLGVAGTICIAILSRYTLQVILECARKLGPTTTYGDIAKASFGRKGEVLICALLLVVTMSVNVAYLVLIGQNMHDLFPGLPSVAWIFVAVPIASLLTFLPDLKYLGFTSVLGALSLIFAMITVVYYGLSEHLNEPIENYPPARVDTLALWFGSAAFFFCNHITVVPIANASGDPKRFPFVLDCTMVFVTVTNLIFAAMGYAFFKDETDGNIIANLPNTGVIVSIVRVCICVELLFSFPLVNAAGLTVLLSTSEFFRSNFAPFLDGYQEEEYDSVNNKAPEDRPILSRNILFYLVRVGIILFLGIVASSISFFGLFVSLVGALMLASAGFIFPPIFHIILFPERSKWRKALHVIIVVFGIFATSLGTYQAIEGIVEAIKTGDTGKSPH